MSKLLAIQEPDTDVSTLWATAVDASDSHPMLHKTGLKVIQVFEMLW